MKTSSALQELRSDVLRDLANSSHRHSSIGGLETPNDITDLVLEYFTPATRSTTECEMLAANGDPSYSAVACSRRSASSAGNGKFFIHQDEIGKLATLKGHLAASICLQQHVQSQHQRPQHSQQQERYSTSAPGPVGHVVGKADLTQKAAATQEFSAEYTPRVQVGEQGNIAQYLTHNRREETPVSARATVPVKGASPSDNSSIMRSWLYPAYAPGNSKGFTLDGDPSKDYMRYGVAQSQSLLRNVDENVHLRPRAHVLGESAAEAAAVPSAAEASTLRYYGLISPRFIPRAVVETCGDKAVLQPALAASTTTTLVGITRNFKYEEPSRRIAYEHDKLSQNEYIITPSVLQRAEPPSRSKKKTQRAQEEVEAPGDHRKEGQTLSSAFPFWRRKSDTQTSPRDMHQAEAPTQCSVPFSTDAGKCVIHQQRIAATGLVPTTCGPSFHDIRPPLEEKIVDASMRTDISSATFPRGAEACSRTIRAPLASTHQVSPSDRAAAVPSEDLKKTRQDDEPSNPNDGGSRQTGSCCSESPDFLGQPAPVRVTPDIADSSAFANSSPVHRGHPISAHRAAANIWAGFFWKSTPPVRLSSSLSSSESCSTQCSSPRGILAGNSGGGDADSTQKAGALSAASSVCASRRGAGALPATSKDNSSPPWRAPFYVNAPAERREQHHARQQGSWPYGYCTAVGATRQTQRVVGHIRQPPRAGEVAKERNQQQSPLPSRYYVQTNRWSRSPLDARTTQAFATPSWLCLYEATRLEVIGVPRGGGATRLLKSTEILLCKTAIAASCPALGARVKEDKTSRQLIFLLPSREVVPVNHVKLVSCISQGSFGTVFRARWDGKTVAVKQAHGCMTLEAMRSVVREVNSFRSLNHPLILKYLGVCLDPNFLGIITEYLPGKSIFEALWDPRLVLTAAKRLKLCRQLVEAVNYMHTEKRLVHRDIKTSNLILNGEDGLKLCDFGKTRPLAFHGRVQLEDNGGSPRYMAPECFAVGNLIDEKVDVWGLGCCLMEIMGGPIPFENIHSNEGVIQAVTRKQMSPTVPSWFHPSIKTLLQKCFALEPEKRPSARQILDVLYMLSPEDVNLHGINTRRTK